MKRVVTRPPDLGNGTTAAELRHVVAAIAAWISLAAAVLIVFDGLLTSDQQALFRATSPLVISAMGFYQMWSKRYNTQLILLVAALLTFVQVALIGSGAYLQTATVALVVIGMVWTMFLPSVRWRHLILYSAFLFMAQVVWGRGAAAPEYVGTALGTIAAFVGASLVTTHLQRAVRATQRRYLDLFNRSPIGLWEEDFSRVRDALEELRSRGIEDLGGYLEDHPDELFRLVGLIDVLDVNEAAVELLGVNSTMDLIGHLPSPQSPSARESFSRQLLAVWDQRDEFELEFVGELRDGSTRDLTIRWSVKSGNQPDYRHVIVAMSDISERKRAERDLQESRDRFERLAANAADVITRLRLRPEPRWEYVSPAIERVTGYTPEDFYADAYIMRRITHPADRSRLAQFMKHPERWDEALTIRTVSASGKEVWAEMRMTPVYDESGSLTYIETVSRDITDRKEYEARLEELIRSKDEFVASVSHELRTPLTAVVGLTHELRDSWSDFRPEEVAELIDTIADQATEVADIVNDLLVAARADMGLVSIHLENVNLAEEACSVLVALPEDDQRRVSAVCNPTTCVADPIRARQIIRNLLTNALRYGGPRIELVTDVSDSMATLEVRDDGVGIPPEDIERIFDPYQRAHSDRSQPASVGLGLTVSRRLAQLMGGNVVYHHQDGMSVFQLSLPAVVPDPKPVPAGRSAQPDDLTRLVQVDPLQGR